jgi:hypothetical protein
MITIKIIGFKRSALIAIANKKKCENKIKKPK